MDPRPGGDRTGERTNRIGRVDIRVLDLLAEADAEPEAIHERLGRAVDRPRDVGYGACCHALARLRSEGLVRRDRRTAYPHGGFSTKERTARTVYAITEPGRERLRSRR